MVSAPTRFLFPLPSFPMLLGQRLIHLIGHCTESQRLLPEIAGVIGTALETEICVLLVGNPGETAFQGVVWTPTQTILLGTTARILEHSWLQAIQSHHHPVLLSRHKTNGTASKIQLTKAIALRSGLGLRTVFQGQVNGMVIIGSSQLKSYSSDDEVQLREIVDTVAIANHLLQTSQREVSSPKELTKNSGGIPRALATEENPIIKAWYEATRQKLEQQRQWNDQLIHNIVTIMSDQTRNPLAIIRMGIEMLRKAPPSPESLNHRLDVIEREWHKLNEINEQILQLRTLKFNQVNLQPKDVNVTQFMTQLAKDYRCKWSDNPDRLTLKATIPKKPLILYSDVAYLQRICDELLNNAQKFSIKNTTVGLSMTQMSTDSVNELVLELSNITTAIELKNTRYFFDPFYREQWVIDSAIAGIGLGLTITQELVEQLNGRIQVTCEPIEVPNACLITFTLTFPLGQW
ncbi:MAG: HAMP domain-containing sensor histidine kinase [Snowella sp.]|nr:HAMP domain-containing sensor histidine kinase [Snowella sp.]